MLKRMKGLKLAVVALVFCLLTVCGVAFQY